MGLIVVDSSKPIADNESALSRWSRLKRGAIEEKSTDSKINENESLPQINWANDDGAENVRLTETEARESRTTETPELPSLDDVSLEKDFTPFMQTKVPEALKRQALKTLFKDAHFNTMDGLDIYIGDYTKFEPITTKEMAGLSSWKSIMKPLEQVVTPGGYAVDVESDEGKAVLAARAQDSIRAVETESERAGDVDALCEIEANDAGSELPSPATSSRPLPAGEATHERYGKRVGDFKSVDTSPAARDQREALGEGDASIAVDREFESASLARPIGRPLPVGEVAANDDPR